MLNELTNKPDIQEQENSAQESESFPSIQWVEERVPLTKLKPFEHNPRRITQQQRLKLIKSLTEFGQFRPLLVTHDYRLAGGHQRLAIMRSLGWKECRVSVPQIAITDAGYKKLVIQDNHNNGTFDMDILANMWDLEELRDIGLHEVMNIPPMDDGEEPTPGKNMVCCPECKHEFPAKGNKVKTS